MVINRVQCNLPYDVPSVTVVLASSVHHRHQHHPHKRVSVLQTIIGLKVREVYERITEKVVLPVS